MIILNIYVILNTKKYIYEKDSIPEVKKDYAIVPGAGLTKEGKPSCVLSDRLDGAIILFEKGLVDKILVSGDHRGESYSETEAMLQYLVSKNVPEDKILRDNEGFSTFETVLNIIKYHGVRSAYFLSQGFHLPRLIYTARKMKMEAFGLVCDFHKYSKKKHRLWKLREIPSRFKDFFLAIYYICTKKI
ncbi:MAG: YdcF family protein [Ruminococcaceae bacterium]|nr:YdcF family protein [Oscillospiraceae bacterium]